MEEVGRGEGGERLEVGGGWMRGGVQERDGKGKPR